MIATARRHAPKDRVLLSRLVGEFRPGPILELGGGVGQIALLLKALGRKVVGSDCHELFVDHQRSAGIDAYRVDATDIDASGVGSFPNVLAYGTKPFIAHKLDRVEAAYGSVLRTLEPRGRLVMVHAVDNRREVARWERVHLDIARRAGFDEVTARRDHLLLPPRAYAALAGMPARIAESMLGPRCGRRFVIIATRPQA